MLIFALNRPPSTGYAAAGAFDLLAARTILATPPGSSIDRHASAL
jgi:hypothetical protein